jgi:hypothetical protein
MMATDKEARLKEVVALAKRLEARSRRENGDKDLLRAGTLLRILMTVMCQEPDDHPAPVTDLACHRGRAH